MNGQLKDRLADWTLLARGSVSACYRARDTVLGRMVLIKTLQSALASDDDLRARFSREARAVARLDHPNLVRLFEFGEDPGVGLYMMLEWVKGETLAERFKRGRLSVEELPILTTHLLAGLGALHRAGIVHRDIKPENILIRHDGVYKITDFSLAALRDEPRLTHHDGIVGTPAYMSPEQAAGKIADARSDLFAAGVVLYEAATGSNPFAAGDLIETLRRIRQVHPDLDGHPELPADTLRLLRACLEKNPSQRPQQAVDAQRLLSPHVAAIPLRSGNRRLRGIVLALSALVIIALLVVITRQSRKLDRESAQMSPAQPFEQVGSAGADSSVVTDSAEHASQATAPLFKITDRTAHVTQPATTQRNAVRDRAGKTRVQPDSTDIVLHVEPWAQVLCDGRQIGTSPFRRPVRLPTGKHVLTFENGALPRVDLPMIIPADSGHIFVNLAEHVATLKIDVQPWGEIYMNGERIGMTPLTRPLFYPPGTHSIRIVHSNLPPLERTFTVVEGDTVSIIADLDRSTLVLKHSLRSATEPGR